MLKKIISMLLLLMILPNALAALTVDLKVESNKIYLDELAEFRLSVINTDMYTKYLNIYTPDIKWYVDFEPTSRTVEGNTRVYYDMTLQPSVWAKPGSQKVKVIVESSNSDEQVELEIPVYVKDYDEVVGEYSPSIEMNVKIPEKYDVRESFPVEVSLRNRNKLNIEILKLNIQSGYFTEDKFITLGPLEEFKETFVFEFSDVTKPANDELEVSVIYNNKSINRERMDYEIIPYSDFIVTEDIIESLFKKTYYYTIKNVGNVKKTDQFNSEVSVLQKIFTTTEPVYDRFDLKNQVFEWTLELSPEEEVEVTVVRNFRPAIYLILIVVILVMMYFIYRSPVIIKKEAIVVGSSNEGISEMKVLLHLRNRSPDLIEHVTLTDLIPALAEIRKETLIGTLAPTKILKHQKKGTIVKWEMDALEPFEERIISYRIKSKMTIVGGFNLPQSKIKFKTKKNTERVIKSNTTQVNLRL